MKKTLALSLVVVLASATTLPVAVNKRPMY